MVALLSQGNRTIPKGKKEEDLMPIWILNLIGGIVLPLVIHLFVPNLVGSFLIALVLNVILALFMKFNVSNGSTLYVIATSIVLVLTYFIGVGCFHLT